MNGQKVGGNGNGEWTNMAGGEMEGKGGGGGGEKRIVTERSEEG